MLVSWGILWIQRKKLGLHPTNLSRSSFRLSYVCKLLGLLDFIRLLFCVRGSDVVLVCVIALISVLSLTGCGLMTQREYRYISLRRVYSGQIRFELMSFQVITPFMTNSKRIWVYISWTLTLTSLPPWASHLATLDQFLPF